MPNLNTCDVLVIEEDRDAARLLEQAFEKARLMAPLHIVRDDDEAKAYLKSEGRFTDRDRFPIPMLILLSPHPPAETSFGLLDWLRKQPRIGGIPVVIIITEGARSEELERAYSLGANSVLVPATVEELLEAVRAIRHYWLLANMGPQKKPERGRLWGSQ